MRSKRKRKQKDLGSLRAKSGAQSAIVDTNACILPNAPEPSSAADHAEVDSDGAKRWQSESKKDMLKRALYMERAGIDVPEDMKLYSGVASEEQRVLLKVQGLLIDE
eukprot:jgi/Picre1/30086/NNA_005457.t1